MEFIVVIAVVGAIWWIIKWADTPLRPPPPMPTAQPLADTLPPQPQAQFTKTPPPETFRKEQALLAAREGRLARPTLLQIIDNARRLGLTPAETRVFEAAMKTKAPAATPIAVDPRTIIVPGPIWEWEEEQRWLESDEYRRQQEEILNER